VNGGTYFAVRDGLLRITCDEPASTWEGRPDGLNVADLRPTEDGQAAIVLLEAPTGGGQVRNLIRIEPSGSISWRGELPAHAATDCFVAFELIEGGDVSAATWSGHRVRLAAEDGRLLDAEFTK